MSVINLTPHEVKIVDEDGNVLIAVPSSGVARAIQNDKVSGSIEIDGVEVEVVNTTFGQTIDLPEPTEGATYIVSIITVSAARANGRSTDDLLITSGPVRSDDGRIIGARRLAHA